MKINQRISTFVLLAATISQFLIPQTAFADFSDVSESYQNFEAITYLQEKGVINGYSDGTFKPDKLVNRAEFLKIIIEGSGIKTDDKAETPFSDTDDTAWYAPYVQKAYYANWVQGYTDGTFKPSQTITKAEALKILGEVQNWEMSTVTKAPFLDTKTTDWFAPYIAFAKENELLETAGKLVFPNQEMSRAKISEIVYRTIIKNISTQPTPTTEQPTTPSNLDFSPANFSQISSTYYANISLDEALPNTFYQNEIYIIKGTITSGSDKEATVSLGSETFTESLSNNHFEIPVIFKKTGNLSLGILPGNSGNTKIQTISVLPTLPSSTNQEIPPSKLAPEIKFSNGKTSVNFQNTYSTIKRLTLTQGSKSTSYLSRQNENTISIFYKDFQDFTSSSVSYQIESAKISSSLPLIISSDFSKSETKTFTPTYHAFSTINENTTASPPETMSSPSKISFTVITSISVETTGYVTTPDGLVEEIELSKNGSTYTYSYTPETSGTYIVEVNNTEGIAVINHPVYIGNTIPLLPDFFDINKRKYFTGTVSLDTMRNEMLNEINKSRKEHGLNEVVLADELNTLAQLHTDDMSKNNYFAHVDLSGNSPEDRRKALKISTPVEENMAKETSIQFAHEGLMRSGSHRSNILEKEWTRVGIGVTKTINDGGYLLIDQEFSTNPISTESLSTMKEEALTKINEKRTDNSLNALAPDQTLDDASKYLNNKIINENATLTNQVFSDTLDSFNIGGQSEAIGHSYNLWSTILDSILNDEESLYTADWLKIGIDIQTDLAGILNTFIIINK
ncbi:MAG: S-layer homology domain-containing protein [Candidatus Peregrinibacteria bacterium]|nr:S-layer homology domain-containing protein [Candidatus Peregrinibacteria bacterium]